MRLKGPEAQHDDMSCNLQNFQTEGALLKADSHWQCKFIGGVHVGSDCFSDDCNVCLLVVRCGVDEVR